MNFSRPPALTEGGGTCETRPENGESAGVWPLLGQGVPVVPVPSASPLLSTSLPGSVDQDGWPRHRALRARPNDADAAHGVQVFDTCILAGTTRNAAHEKQK